MPKRAQKQSYIRKTRFLQAALLSLCAGSAAADPLLDAITGGHVSLQLRPRYQFMQQAGKEDANAFTLRTL
ncbi:MAG: alginate export family protein, partial [Acidithiobacillus sp.]